MLTNMVSLKEKYCTIYNGSTLFDTLPIKNCGGEADPRLETEVMKTKFEILKIHSFR